MNIEQIRKDAIGCTDKLFLNNAGSSLIPHAVISKMEDYLQKEELSGGYLLAQQHEHEIEDLYSEIAKQINCAPRNIAYMHSATEAYFRALSAINFKPGDALVTADDDYVSNQIAFLSLKKRFNIEIYRAGTTANGDLDTAHLEELVKKHQPVLVAITHVPSSTGKIQDAITVGAICKKYNVWYSLDACQSCGQLVVDAKAIGCDFLSATGRKFMRGPRGTGFLYVSDKALDAGLEPMTLDFRGAAWTEADQYKSLDSAKRFELFETNIATLLGFREAVRYSNNIGMQNIYNYNQELSKLLRKNLSEISGVRMLDEGTHLSNIITFHLAGKDLVKVEEELIQEKVFYSVSRRNLSIINFGKKEVDWAIRFSPHYFNTIDEMNKAAEIVASIK